MKNYFEFCRGQISEIVVLCFQLERAVFMLVLVRNSMIFPKRFKNFPKFQKFISFSVFEWAGPTRILIESSKSNLFKNHIFSRFWNFWTKCSELEVVNFCKKAENVQLLTSINLSKSSKIDCKCYFWTDYE